MNFKEWWKKLSYWKKGAIIGFLIPIIIFIIGMLLDSILVHFMTNENEAFLRSIQSIYHFPLFLFSWILDLLFKFKIIPCRGEACAYGGPQMVVAVFSPMIYAAIGAIIGLITSKIKKQ